MKRRIGWIVVALGIVVVSGSVVALRARRRPKAPSGATAPAASRAPEGQRVRVEVINATTERGLARRATEFLRDRGFDVVQTGTTSDLRDSTLVLDRTAHPDWARRIAIAFGNARVEAQPDTSRYVDATVLLGASWRPPAEPFHP